MVYKKKKTYEIGFFGIVLLILLLIISVYLLNNYKILTIKVFDVRVFQVECTSEQTVKNSVNILGRIFFLVSEDTIKKILMEKFICIKRINLSKFFPNKVKLEIWGREPSALLINLKNEASISAVEDIATPAASTSSQSYLVDDDGVIFGKGSNDNLLKIFLYNSNLLIGEKLNNIKDSLKILKKVKGLGMTVSESVMLKDFLIVFSYPKTIFKLDNSINAQIASLQLILQKAKIDNEELEFIDLRFDKPVIKIIPKKH